MEKYPELSMWAQYNHRGLPKKESRDQRKRRKCDDETETSEGALVLVSKRETEARSQGMQGVPHFWKGRQMDSPL